MQTARRINPYVPTTQTLEVVLPAALWRSSLSHITFFQENRSEKNPLVLTQTIQNKLIQNRLIGSVVVLSTLTVKQGKSARVQSVWRVAGVHHDDHDDNDDATKTQIKMLRRTEIRCNMCKHKNELSPSY